MIVFSVTFPSVAANTSSDSATSNCFSVTSTLSVDGNSSFHPQILLLRHKQAVVNKSTLHHLPLGIDAVLWTAFSDVLHQDLHQHTKVFLTQIHLKTVLGFKTDWKKGIGTSCHHTAVDLQLNICREFLCLLLSTRGLKEKPTLTDGRTPWTWTPGSLPYQEAARFLVMSTCRLIGWRIWMSGWEPSCFSVVLKTIHVLQQQRKTVSRFEASLTPQHLFHTFFTVSFLNFFSELWIVTWTVSAEWASHPSFPPPLAVRNLQLATERSCFPL